MRCASHIITVVTAFDRCPLCFEFVFQAVLSIDVCCLRPWACGVDYIEMRRDTEGETRK